MIELPSAQTFT